MRDRLHAGPSPWIGADREAENWNGDVGQSTVSLPRGLGDVDLCPRLDPNGRVPQARMRKTGRAGTRGGGAAELLPLLPGGRSEGGWRIKLPGRAPVPLDLGPAAARRYAAWQAQVGRAQI